MIKQPCLLLPSFLIDKHIDLVPLSSCSVPTFPQQQKERESAPPQQHAIECHKSPGALIEDKALAIKNGHLISISSKTFSLQTHLICHLPEARCWHTFVSGQMMDMDPNMNWQSSIILILAAGSSISAVSYELHMAGRYYCT